ncbi:unnamed protein product, partial [marine sediment metagenome]
MKVLLTGQVGLDKGEFLKEVQRIAEKKGRRISFESIGSRMLQVYEGRHDDTTILNLPRGELNMCRRHVWKEITREAQAQRAEDIFIVNSHAVFRWHHGLFPAIDLDLVWELAPDVLVTLIDDVDKVVEGLEERGTGTFEMWELLAWREEEIWFTKFLRDGLSRLVKGKIEFFVLAKEHGP